MSFLLTAAAAVCLSLLLTPAVRWLSLRTGWFGGSKEAAPIPPTGGIAVFLSWVACLFLLTDPVLIPLAVGAAAMALTGLLDDVRPLRPVHKLALQAASAGIAVGLGLRLDLLGATLADSALTVVWLVWIANAYNVLDMMDGLAAGVGMVAAGALVLLGGGTVPGLILAGALAGFLIHNYHPARIYMGDTGSLFVGFTLGGLAVNASTMMPAPQAVLCPLLVLGVPSFEGTFLTVVRKRRGLPVTRSSRDHVAQRLVRLGASIRGAVARVHLAGIVLAVVAVLGAQSPAWLCWAYAASCGAIAVALGIRLSVSAADPA